MKTKLVDLFDKYNCDKGNIKHRYDRVYEQVLSKVQNDHITMLEIGIFKGNSTEAFVDFCPNITVVGVDIFTRVDMKDIPILNHKQVFPVKCDSLVGPNEEFIKIVGDMKFDIIIDDGLHTHEAQRKTFENFIPYLKDDGVYFIEDVWAFDRMTDKEKQHPWVTKQFPAFSDEEYNKLIDTLKPYKVTHHDLRDGFNIDTFILEIRK